MQNVAIFGVPRSGTSWLGQLFNSSPHVVYRFQPIFAYSFEGSIENQSSKEDIDAFHRDLLQTDDEFVCQKKNVSGNATPDFYKVDLTHLVWKEVRYLNVIRNLIEQSSTKVIGIVRHPCGVIKSWKEAPKELRTGWNLGEGWRYAAKKNTGNHDFYGYERWIEATQMFINIEKNYPDRFKTVKYESLLENGQHVLEKLFNFVGLSLTKQTRDFFAESTTKSSSDPYDVYRQKKDGYEWKNNLNPEIIGKILSDQRFQNIDRLFKWNLH